MTPLGPFDGFAATLRARHRRRGGAVPALDAVVLRPPRPRHRSWHLHVAGPQFNVAPRIALTLAGQRAEERAPARASVAATAPALTARLRHATSTVRVREALTLVEHTHTRGVRVEPGRASVATLPSALAALTDSALLPAPAPLRSPPLSPPLVIARPAPPAPVPPTLGATEPPRVGRLHDATPPAPASAPSIDVERITDSVLGALDRRLIANRERYGSM